LAGDGATWSAAAPISRREQAKAGRRGRIAAAARDLLREVGVEALSMKMVAARAVVSLSTVYNLFGSKQAVLAAVFDADLVDYQAMVAAAVSADALERIFTSVDVAADLYHADPEFYRAIMRRWLGNEAGERQINAALRGPRVAFWRGMIAEAQGAGHLRPDADPGVLAALIVQIFGGVLSDWIAEDITAAQLALEAKFGFAAALAPFATPTDTIRLTAKAHALHTELAAFRGHTPA
jgi:AcrR family transcriptional regulator